MGMATNAALAASFAQLRPALIFTSALLCGYGCVSESLG